MKHTGNSGLFIIFTAVYVGLLLLFCWQTWLFVDWLFPGEEIMMKLLTVLCFDVMALLWACLDLFYRFATRGSRILVRWAWGISFVLSLLASIFYLVIRSMFRFDLELSVDQVNVGYGVTIVALTLQVLFLTFWLYGEWLARHPHRDDYEVAPQPTHRVTVREEARKAQPRPASKPVTTPKALPAPKSQTTDRDYIEFLAWKKQQAAKKTTTTAKSAQPARTVRAAPSRVAQVAEAAEIEEAEEIIEEITDQAETLPTNEEAEEIEDSDDEVEDGQDIDESDEVEDDEQFDDFNGDHANTEEVAVVNVTPAPAKEAVPARVPLSQRLGQAWNALTSSEIHGPTRLAKKK